MVSKLRSSYFFSIAKIDFWRFLNCCTRFSNTGCRRGEDVLLGDGNVADDERYGIQRLRSDLDLSQLSSQRHCEPTTDTARRSNRRFQRYARGQTHRQTGHADHNPSLPYWGRSCYFYPVMYARPFFARPTKPKDSNTRHYFYQQQNLSTARSVHPFLYGTPMWPRTSIVSEIYSRTDRQTGHVHHTTPLPVEGRVITLSSDACEIILLDRDRHCQEQDQAHEPRDKYQKEIITGHHRPSETVLTTDITSGITKKF